MSLGPLFYNGSFRNKRFMALGRGLGLKVLLMTTHYSPLFAGSVCHPHFRYPQMRWNCPSNCSKYEVQVTWHSNSALSTHQVIILSFYHKLSLGATGVEHMTSMWWCYKGSTEEKRWKFYAFLSHAKDLTLGFSTICEKWSALSPLLTNLCITQKHTLGQTTQ